jgi:hypothetical protein
LSLSQQAIVPQRFDARGLQIVPSIWIGRVSLLLLATDGEATWPAELETAAPVRLPKFKSCVVPGYTS